MTSRRTPPSSSRTDRASRSRREANDDVEPERNPAGWMDRLAHLQTHFGRFLGDVVGILFFAIALLTLFGLVGLAQEGVLLTEFVGVLRVWFGWGSYLIVVLFGVAGVLIFRRRRSRGATRWGRVIALELAGLLTLAVLSVISGNSLFYAESESGAWGGQIGWGLATLVVRFLGEWAGGAVIFLMWILAWMTGFGVWYHLELWLFKQAGEPVPGSGSDPVEEEETPFIPPLPVEKPVAAEARDKKQAPLPPEFRKSFKVSQREDESPAKPQERDSRLPPLNVLITEQNVRPDERHINQTAGLIEKTLSEFGIPAKVVGFRIGPNVTQFAVQPGFIKKAGSSEEERQLLKVRVAQIASLQKDLALALSAERLRIEAPVPGRAYVGIEVPNTRLSVVRLRPILDTDAFYKVGSPLTIALGRDVSGNPLVADLAHMPHLLIAGTTGSGKSVCISALATCLAMNNPPEDLRMVMIDSKMVELIRFNGLAHLFGKVETDIQRILGVLRWVVVEMEHRYQLLEAAKAREIDAYNRRLQRRKDVQPLPRIVVLIDELADLMMSAPDQTEHNLVRLAQMARATGIHLVVATQRPSTDVVTGLIKANFPARLSFSVASQVDSRVILDLPGADTLLGRGDMLFLNPEIGSPVRAQGVLVTDQEIERIIAFWQQNNPAGESRPPWESMLSESLEAEGSDDVLIERAVTLLKREQRASASMFQRRLRIGYPRAARLLDQLEEMGVVGPSQGGGRERDVLIGPDEEE